MNFTEFIEHTEVSKQIFQKHSDTAIERINKQKRFRQRWSVVQVVIWLPAMLLDFWKGDYWWGIGQTAWCMLMVWFLWWSHERSIQGWRKLKRKSAQYKLDCEKQIQEARELRGF